MRSALRLPNRRKSRALLHWSPPLAPQYTAPAFIHKQINIWRCSSHGRKSAAQHLPRHRFSLCVEAFFLCFVYSVWAVCSVQSTAANLWIFWCSYPDKNSRNQISVWENVQHESSVRAVSLKGVFIHSKPGSGSGLRHVNDLHVFVKQKSLKTCSIQIAVSLETAGFCCAPPPHS